MTDTRAPLRRRPRAWRESDWAKAELIVFDHLVAVVKAGERCPDNGAIRAMRILEGDAAGRTSRPEPHGYDAYLIIGKTNRYPRKDK